LGFFPENQDWGVLFPLFVLLLEKNLFGPRGGGLEGILGESHFTGEFFCFPKTFSLRGVLLFLRGSSFPPSFKKSLLRGLGPRGGGLFLLVPFGLGLITKSCRGGPYLHSLDTLKGKNPVVWKQS